MFLTKVARRVLPIMLASGFGVVIICAQSSSLPTIANTNAVIDPARFAIQLISNVRAMGSRLQVPGNERVMITGTLTLSGITSPMTIYYELPDKFRFDLQGRTVVFDGNVLSTTKGTISESDEDMVESFVEDSPEVMFYSLLNAPALRVIAMRARMDDGKAQNYTGPWTDIHQVVGLTISRRTPVPRQKHYYFDSATHLAVEVRYRLQHADGTIAAARVTRTNWMSVNGQPVPGTIMRTENGNIVFLFQSGTAAVGPTASDGLFAPNAGNQQGAND